MKLYFEKINRIRKDKGLSVTGLCKLSEITRATLWNWENTKQIPNEANVRKLAKALNVGVDEISDLKEIDNRVNHDFSNAVDSWELLTQMDKNSQENKFHNILKELSGLNNNITQAKTIINALTSSMNIIFYIKDSNLNYLIASNSFISNLKLNPNYKVFGKRDDDFFSIREAKLNYLEDKEILENNNSIYREDYIPGSRKKKWGLIKKQPVLNSEGKTVGVIGIFIDITDKKTAEEKRDIFMHLLDEFPFIIALAPTATNNGMGVKLSYVNKTVERLTGIPMKEIYANNTEYISNKIVYTDPTGISIKEMIQNADSQKLFEKDSFYNIIRVILNDKIKWNKGINQTAKYNGVEYAIAIDMDITEEKEKESEINTYQQIIEELIDDKQTITWGAKLLDNGKIYLFHISHNFEEITGYRRIDFIDQTPIDEVQLGIPLNRDPYENKKQVFTFIHPDYHELIKKAVKSGKISQLFQFKIITSSKKALTLKTTLSRKEIAGLNTVYFGKAEIV
jgi:transcriptional regulator with XRE-family HTH domain